MVPVLGLKNEPLMPCSEKRARKLIEKGEAFSFWKKGIFCIRLKKEPSSKELQKIVVGIDPGSMKEGYTVKSEAHTLLNIQADAITWVKERLEFRKNCRRSRRFRKTPYRKCRSNRKTHKYPWLAPSTKARWQWKLRICNWLKKLYPIEKFIVEDIKARNFKGKTSNFSILETGKIWFYVELGKLGSVETMQGYETAKLRNELGLTKTKAKLSNVFEAHCVDSWVLAYKDVGGLSAPENKRILFLIPFRHYRRRLHVQVPIKGGFRKHFGSTRSLGFKRGSLVKHSEYGLTYISGNSIIQNKNYKYKRISLNCIFSGDRISVCAQVTHIKFLTISSWRWNYAKEKS